MKNCSNCNSEKLEKVYNYSKRPKGEFEYFQNQKNYSRSIFYCSECAHFFSDHNMDVNELYSKLYNEKIYKDENGMIKRFDYVNNLEESLSDNKLRCNRIEYFLKSMNLKKKNINILDIGSGMGIFPFEMNKRNYRITALDPDINSVNFIKKFKINAIHGDINTIKLDQKYDFITLNKVLEHFLDPHLSLSKIKSFLKKTSFLYIEVPDGEAASKESFEREEFFIDHINIYSKKSLSYLLKMNNIKILEIQSYIDPSSKMSISCFCSF